MPQSSCRRPCKRKKKTDEALTELAESTINQEARQAAE
jgi:hypothetical protein